MAALAAAIAKMQAAKESAEQAEILKMLEQLSDEDAEKELRMRTQNEGQK